MALNNLSLLFIEDDTNTQEYISMLLEDEVREFYQAFDGAEGLKLIKDKKPDIILTDINMPLLNGIELIKEIRKESDKPIIVMSAYHSKEDILNTINAGANAFITKPIDVDILLEKLNEMAQRVERNLKSEQKTRNQLERLYQLAHYDTLTNIPNKLMFDIKLLKTFEEAYEKQKRFAVFFIDLDKFKSINDLYGHDVGDFVLKSIVDNILDVLDDNMLLARRSGDEFLLLVDNYKDNAELENLAERILKKVSEPINYKDLRLEISCSIGISRYPDDAKSYDELMEKADKFMYEVKKSGKADYFLTSS